MLNANPSPRTRVPNDVLDEFWRAYKTGGREGIKELLLKRQTQKSEGENASRPSESLGPDAEAPKK